MNGELITKVDTIDKKLDEHINHEEERDAIQKRVRILHFGDELRRYSGATEESFEQVMIDIDEYMKYCDAHPGFKNSITVHTIELINKKYQDYLSNNSFLQ